MDAQAAYEHIKTYFAGDTPFGFDPVAEKCRYRTEQGNRCAVGCFISDDEYAKLALTDMFESPEGLGIDQIAVALGWMDRGALDIGEPGYEENAQRLVDFLTEAQNCHDQAAISMTPGPDYTQGLHPEGTEGTINGYYQRELRSFKAAKAEFFENLGLLAADFGLEV